MSTVSVRDLRNNGGRVLERVANGESLIVTMDGRPIAELRPLPGSALSATALLARWRRLPPVDPEAFRADVDRVIDSAVCHFMPVIPPTSVESWDSKSWPYR